MTSAAERGTTVLPGRPRSGGLDQPSHGSDHQVRPIELDVVSRAPRHRVRDAARRKRLEARLPGGPDRLVGPSVQPRLATWRDEGLDRDPQRCRLPKQLLTRRPIQPVDRGHVGAQAIESLGVLAAQRAQQRMDERDLEVWIERVDQDQTHDFALGGGKGPPIGTAQRVTDGDERRLLAGYRQERPEVVDGLAKRLPRPRITAAAARPVVGARPCRQGELVLDARPRRAVGTRARLEHDRRPATPTAVEVERPSADVDATTLGNVRARNAVAREPSRESAGSVDVNGCRDAQAGRHRRCHEQERRQPARRDAGGSHRR